MCVVSMIYDHGRRELDPFRPVPQIWPSQPFIPNEEAERRRELERRVKALEDLLAAAKKYDDATGQPDCESDAKRKQLKDLADELGVKINFPE